MGHDEHCTFGTAGPWWWVNKVARVYKFLKSGGLCREPRFKFICLQNVMRSSQYWHKSGLWTNNQLSWTCYLVLSVFDACEGGKKIMQSWVDWWCGSLLSTGISEAYAGDRTASFVPVCGETWYGKRYGKLSPNAVVSLTPTGSWPGTGWGTRYRRPSVCRSQRTFNNVLSPTLDAAYYMLGWCCCESTQYSGVEVCTLPASEFCCQIREV